MKAIIIGNFSGQPASFCEGLIASAEKEIVSLSGDLRPTRPLPKCALHSVITQECFLESAIHLMAGCQAAYFLSGWERGAASRTLHYYAWQSNMKTIYQGAGSRAAQIQRASDAVRDVFGFAMEEFREQTRRRVLFFPRMTFSVEMHRIARPITDEEIAQLVCRDRSTVLYYYKTYKNEVEVNREFAEAALTVRKTLELERS